MDSKCHHYQALCQPTSSGWISLVYFQQTSARKLKWSSEHTGKERTQGSWQSMIIICFICYRHLRCVSSLWPLSYLTFLFITSYHTWSARHIHHWMKRMKIPTWKGVLAKSWANCICILQSWTGGSSSLIFYGNTWVCPFAFTSYFTRCLSVML